VTEFLLVRHGETDWNAEQRFQGHADPPLNDVGRDQARALSDQLATADIDGIYTSDLGRARETAEIVGARTGAPVVPLADLREIDVGEWQGLTWPEIERRFPDGMQRWQDHGHGWTAGETYEQLEHRVLRTLRSIASDHPAARLLVVGHGGTIRVVRAFVEGRSVALSRRASRAIGNCEIFRIRVENGEFRGID
jgi:broad specificity phosphatase PhoE